MIIVITLEGSNQGCQLLLQTSVIGRVNVYHHDSNLGDQPPE